MTQRLSFTTLDVFTDTPYFGNPLAVVYLREQDSASLTQSQKQLIAREFNLSETVFLHLPSEADENGVPVWTINIFTTATELAFAGHPTIGTAFYVLSTLTKSDDKSIISGAFKCKAGRIDLSFDPSTKLVSAAIPQNFHIHATTFSVRDILDSQPRLTHDSFARITHRLANDTSIRITQDRPGGFPVASIVNGMTFILIELADLDELAKVEGQSIYSNATLDEGWDSTLIGRYFYVRMPDAEDRAKQVRTRFVMSDGEDPATGSAASDLCCWLSVSDEESGEGELRWRVTQGVEMGRKSTIGVHVTLGEKGEGEGRRKVERVVLRGSAVQVIDGTLRI